MSHKLKHIGLFEGIGGFSIAAHWAGWQTIAICEWDADCTTILNHHFPTAQFHENICHTDFTIYRGRIDILTAGFPCQPFSHAGLRKGTDDERHLAPETLRAIGECRPTWVVLENVPGILSIHNPPIEVGGKIHLVPQLYDNETNVEHTNTAIAQKTVCAIVAELEDLGYTLTPMGARQPQIGSVPAATVGAPHMRDRIWIVAHANKHDAAHDGGKS
jgi:DNA (cytosine-5)-methyltransferase 1